MYTRTGLGTPRVITTQSGTEVWDWPAVQNPFGERAASGDDYTFNLRFPGQYFDAETGLHYNMARDYEPATGRYIESDPIGLLAGPSTYAYVGNSPLVTSDEQGLMFCRDWGWMAIQWALGIGDRNMTYGDMSDQSQEVRRIPTVEKARGEFNYEVQRV